MEKGRARNDMVTWAFLDEDEVEGGAKKDMVTWAFLDEDGSRG